MGSKDITNPSGLETWKIWFWVVIFALGIVRTAGAGDITTPYTSDDTWEVPALVTEITIKAWGGGDGGGKFRGGGDAGGGGYAEDTSVSVTPGNTLYIKVGGGSGGGGAGCFISTLAGTDGSWFGTGWSISGISGLLAFVGLLWLGRRKKGR